MLWFENGGMKVKKFLISSILLGITTIVNAAPNNWIIRYAQGTLFYTISDLNKNELTISCNMGNDPTKFDNDIELYLNGELHTASEEPNSISFRINDRTDTITHPISTKTIDDYSSWHLYIRDFSSAQKIDIYYKNKYATTMYPISTQPLDDIEDVCRSMFELEFRLQSEAEGREYVAPVAHP